MDPTCRSNHGRIKRAALRRRKGVGSSRSGHEAGDRGRVVSQDDCLKSFEVPVLLQSRAPEPRPTRSLIGGDCMFLRFRLSTLIDSSKVNVSPESHSGSSRRTLLQTYCSSCSCVACLVPSELASITLTFGISVRISRRLC